MRLSRQYRVGVVTPTSVTFANAISACGRGDVPDLESARYFLDMALQDGIQPTVFKFIGCYMGCGTCKKVSEILS